MYATPDKAPWADLLLPFAPLSSTLRTPSVQVLQHPQTPRSAFHPRFCSLHSPSFLLALLGVALFLFTARGRKGGKWRRGTRVKRPLFHSSGDSVSLSNGEELFEPRFLLRPSTHPSSSFPPSGGRRKKSTEESYSCPGCARGFTPGVGFFLFFPSSSSRLRKTPVYTPTKLSHHAVDKNCGR